MIIDISGFVYRKFGVQGMWTVVSDLSNAQVVGSAPPDMTAMVARKLPVLKEPLKRASLGR